MQVTPSGERPFPTPPTPNAPDPESARFANRDAVVLPDEMVTRILMYLGTTDIAVCRSVSRQWKTVIDARHLLARSFCRDCHLTQRINSLAAQRYHSHIRGWLTDFSDRGRETAEQLDNILGDVHFPEVLFFSIPKLLLNTNELTCQNVATIWHPGIVRDASFSPDGKYLVTVSYDNHAKLWELEGDQWREKVTLRHSEWMVFASFSLDGKLLVTASIDYICKIWRLEDDQWQEKAAIQHFSVVNNASFSPDGKHLVTVSDGPARIWGLEDDGRWEEKVSIWHFGWREVTSAQFSPDGKHLVTTSHQGTKIYKLDDGQWQEKVTIQHFTPVMNARFSPDGKHLVTVTRSSTHTNNAILWELVDVQSQENVTIQQWQERVTIEHSDIVNNVHFSPDGKHLVTASHDGPVRICGLEGGRWQVKDTIQHCVLTNASFSRDGKFLVTVSYDGPVRICRLVDGKWHEIVTIEHFEAVINASFGPDCRLVTVSSDNSVKIWVLKDKENDGNSELVTSL